MIIELLNWLGLDPATCLFWIFVITLTLFVLDIFAQTGIISWLSMIIFSFYITLLVEHYTDISWAWSVLIYGIVLGIFVFLYTTLWRKFVKNLLEKTLLRHAAKEQTERASGQIGTFRRIGKEEFVELEGELWPAKCEGEDSNNFSDQDNVEIIKCEEGSIFFQRKPNKQ